MKVATCVCDHGQNYHTVGELSCYYSKCDCRLFMDIEPGIIEMIYSFAWKMVNQKIKQLERKWG